jgi:hypothetical protein
MPKDAFFSIIRFYLAVFLVFIVPGELIIRIAKLPSSMILIPALGIAANIPISLLLSRILGFFDFLNHFSLFYIFLLMVLVFHIMKDQTNKREILLIQDGMSVFLFLTTLIIIISFILLLYPEMANSPYNDVVRHYPGGMRKALATPDLVTAVYPAYYILLLSLSMLIPDIPYSIFQTGLATLSVLVVLSFFAMARKYANNSVKIASVSTLFFSLFAGFGWTYIVREKIFSNSLSEWAILQSAVSNTFFDTYVGGSSWLWIWFRPLTLGFFYFLVLLYLLKERNLSTRKSIALFTVSHLMLFLLHISEALFFVVLLIAMRIATFLTNTVDGFRIKEAFQGMIYAVILFLWVYIAFDQIFGFTRLKLVIQPLFIIIITILILSSSFLFKLSLFSNLSKKDILISRNKLKYSLGILFSIYYVLSILYYYYILDLDIHWAFYAFSWYSYPLLLGITGILIIIAIFSNNKHLLPLWLGLGIITIIAVSDVFKVPSLILTQYVRRSMLFAWISASLIASFSFIKIIDSIKARFRLNSIKKVIACTLCISIVVSAGFMSTCYSVIYWTIFLNQEYSVLRGEGLENIQNFREILKNDARSVVLTLPTPFEASLEESMMAGPGIALSDKWIWASVHPETALIMLRPPALFVEKPAFSYFKPPQIQSHYFYIRKRDVGLLNDYKGGYIFHVLAEASTIIAENSYSTVYKMPSYIAPSLESEIVLLITAFDNYPNYIMHDILSFSGIPYTSVFNLADLANKKIIILLDDYIDPTVLETILFNVRSGATLIIFGLDYTTFIREKLFPDILSPFREKVLFEDLTNYWTAFSRGKGNIGTPIIANSYKRAKISSSLRISIPNGTNSQWIIKHVFDKPQNWSDYDFLTFYWYGANTAGKIVVTLHCPEGEFTYYFDDIWIGWRKVILPLDASYGQIFIGGMEIFKGKSGNPSLNNITALSFRNAAQTPNLANTWYLEHIALLKLNPLLDTNDIHFGTTYLNNITISSWFVDKLNRQVPFVMSRNYGKGVIVYIDYTPFIANMRLNSRELIDTLVKNTKFALNITSLIDKEQEAYEGQYVFSKALLFYNATVSGNITIESDSFVLESWESSDIMLSFIANQTLKTINATKLIVTKGKLSFKASNVTISNGYGFYSKMILKGDQFLLRGFSQLYATNNNSILPISMEGPAYIRSSMPLTLYARIPTISLNGSLSLVDFKLKRNNYKGVISFRIPLSDNISLIDNFSCEDTLTMFVERLNADFKFFMIVTCVTTICYISYELFKKRKSWFAK